jgi:hypothetical protein
MRCLIYALKEWHKNKGKTYFVIVQSKAFKFPFPHFIHAEKLEKYNHMTADGPPKHWTKEIWYAITGQHYKEERKDE